MKKALTLISIVVLGMISIYATSSTNLNVDSFEVFIGDVDGDGADDLYLAAIPRLLIIAEDINIPITIFDAKPILFQGYGDGTLREPTVWEAAVNLGDMSVANYTLHSGDFNGDGIQDLFLQSDSISYQSIVLNGDTTNLALNTQVFSRLEGKEVSADYSSIQVEDVNGDGKDDIILDYGLSSETIALALTTNRFNTVAYDDSNYQMTYVPGSTSGQFSVSNSLGSSSYVIPLALPVGSAGMQPSLAIAYNSSAGNGLLGVGFSLSGHSSIERCQKNRSLDGFSQPIDIVSYESFCLDGNRMVSVNEFGREFRLAQDLFAKITSYGGTAEEPDYFEIRYKSGELATYGSSDQAKLDIKGVASTWAVSDKQDRVGNKIAYSYNIRENTITPSYIIYANNRIDFEYSDRGDDIKGYKNGNLQVIDKILKRVDISVDNHQFRSYALNYEFTTITEHSRLTSITECGADGTCLKPTTFSWSQAPEGSVGIANESTAYELNACSNSSSCTDSKVSFADINGDGATDICYRDESLGIICRINDGEGEFPLEVTPPDNLCKNSYTSEYGRCNDSDNYNAITYQDFNLDGMADIAFRSDNGVVFYASTGTGFVRVPLNNDDVCGNGTKNSTTLLGCNDSDNYNTVKYADVNGDRIPDICYRSDGGIACAISTGINSEGSAPEYSEDILMTSACNNGHNDYNVCAGGDFSFVDSNSDGMDDLVYRARYLGVAVHYSTGSSFDDLGMTSSHSQEKPNVISDICDSYSSTSRTPECDSANNYELIFYPDLNGDGQVDICWRSDDGIKCYLGTGDDSSAETAYTSLISTTLCDNSECDAASKGFVGTAIQFADFNNDGKSDLFFRSLSGFRLHLFNGESFSPSPDWSSSYCANKTDPECNDLDNFTTVRLIDVDNDSLPDLVYRADDVGYKIIKNNLAVDSSLTNEELALLDVINKIETGMGITTEIEYTRFLSTQSDISCVNVHCMANYYSNPDKYPNTVLNSLPMPLVKRVQSTASDGFLSGVSYRYYNFTSHADGFASPSFKYVWEFKYSQRNSIDGESIDFATTEPDSYVRHEYITDDEYLFGRLRSTQSYLYRMSGDLSDLLGYPENDSNSFMLAETEHSYEHVNSHSADERIQFSRILRTTEYSYGNGIIGEIYPYVKTEDTYQYSNNGNVSVHNKAISDRHMSSAEEEIVKEINTVRLYEDEREADWIIGLVTQATVTKSVPISVSGTAGSSESTKDTRFQYNALGQLEAKISEPNTEYQITTGYTYNNFGLKATQVVSASGVASVTSSYGYGEYGRFVTSVMMSNSDNEKSYTTFSEYDPVLGVVISKTNANGLISTSEIDGYGRVISETDPFGLVTAIDYEFSNDAYYVVTANNLGSASLSYYNKAGKLKSTRTQSLTGQVINKQYSYFEDGGIQWESLPYFDGDTNYKMEVIARDNLNRPTQTRTPAGYDEFMAYNGFTTVTTNSLQQIKTLEKNALGQTTRSEDHLGNELIFFYNADDQLLSTLDVEANTRVSTSYDRMGHRIAISDPDKGDWSFTYNVFGKMITQTNANGQTTCFVYDELSRLVKRIDEYSGDFDQAKLGCSVDAGINRTATWSYDSAVMGTTENLVQGALSKITGPDGYEEEYFYDNLGRVIGITRKIAGTIYHENTSYDEFGRVNTHTYPSGLSTKNIYGSRGMLVSVVNDQTGYSYWQAKDSDALGNITQELLGDNIIQTRGYSQSQGTIDWIRAYVNEVSEQDEPTIRFVHSMDYEFNSLGNLVFRSDNLQGPDGLAETFSYDKLNRLTTNSFFDHGNRYGVATSREDYSYENNGNLSYKLGVGTYYYDETNGVGPHAVTRTELNNVVTDYFYDRNGNLTMDDQRSIAYASFDKPLSIVSSNGSEVSFKYGPGRNRVQRHDINSSGKVVDTIYAAPGYEIVTTQAFEGAPEKTEVKQYLPGGALIIEKTENDESTKASRFMLSDHIGSVTTIVDGDGTVMQRFSFDPWGKRRNINWTQVWGISELNSLIGEETTRGFTGHEMLDSVGIIHMNGRIYNPLLGRFLNADPIVQAPTNYQSLNRYSYVLNNPLTLTDPSGHVSLRQFGRWLDKNVLRHTGAVYHLNKRLLGELKHQIKLNPEEFQIVGSIGCAVYAGPSAPECIAVVSAATTYAVTEDFDLAMKAGASAWATAHFSQNMNNYIDDNISNPYLNILAKGSSAGTVSVANNGNFKEGFKWGAGSQALAEVYKGMLQIGIDAGEADNVTKGVYPDEIPFATENAGPKNGSIADYKKSQFGFKYNGTNDFGGEKFFQKIPQNIPFAHPISIVHDLWNGVLIQDGYNFTITNIPTALVAAPLTIGGAMRNHTYMINIYQQQEY